MNQTLKIAHAASETRKKLLARKKKSAERRREVRFSAKHDGTRPALSL